SERRKRCVSARDLRRAGGDREGGERGAAARRRGSDRDHSVPVRGLPPVAARMALRARLVPPGRRLSRRVRGRRPPAGHVGPAVVAARTARAADEERLRELTFESKAHWGYDHDLVHTWADQLEFPPDCDRWVAEEDGRIVGWVGVAP